MAQRVFLLNTLRESADPAEYEDWIRRVDYPIARSQASILSYVVIRLDGHVGDATGPLPAEYVEVIDITDIDEYRADPPKDPDFQRLMEEWRQFVEHSTMVYGEVIE